MGATNERVPGDDSAETAACRLAACYAMDGPPYSAWGLPGSRQRRACACLSGLLRTEARGGWRRF